MISIDSIGSIGLIVRLISRTEKRNKQKERSKAVGKRREKARGRKGRGKGMVPVKSALNLMFFFFNEWSVPVSVFQLGRSIGSFFGLEVAHPSVRPSVHPKRASLLWSLRR